jgi:hypothetical protein
MFELYTEKARRSIFFARYEASQFGSPYIETEHLLLGLLRENRGLLRLLPPGSAETIRKQIEAHTAFRESVSTSVDLPLSNDSKRVLAYAAEEAQHLGHKHIGTEHLFLGLIREKGSFASEILHEKGLALDRVRESLVASEAHDDLRRVRRVTGDCTVEIHGAPRNAESIHERVKVSRRFDWYWHKGPWKARDLVACKLDGRLSFDVSLATDTENFELRKGAWEKDQCAICRWELFESDTQPEHGIAYTNGHNWVCTECYEQFLEGPDFFATAHPEIT